MVKEGAFLWVGEAVNGVYFWGRVKRENGWVLIFISFIPLPTISPNQPALCPDRLGHPSWDVQQAFGGVCLGLREEDLGDVECLAAPQRGPGERSRRKGAQERFLGF